MWKLGRAKLNVSLARSLLCSHQSRKDAFEMSGRKLRVVQALLSFLTALLEDLAL